MNPDQINNLNEDPKDWDAEEERDEKRANEDNSEPETI